jgi:hypothetical protein
MPTKVFTPGEILTAANTNAYLANRPLQNAIINGGFDIWQRGTSFTTASGFFFTADRWSVNSNGSGATRTISRQPHPPGSAPEGSSSPFFWRQQVSVAPTGQSFNVMSTLIEDVQTFAGQTITVSYYAKASAAITMSNGYVEQNFGTSGSASVSYSLPGRNLTTVWERFTHTIPLDGISGKTVNANSYLGVVLNFPLNSTFTIDIADVQLEAGTVANDFRRNANSIQGELAACQRYYYRYNSPGTGNFLGFGSAYSATGFLGTFQLPVNLRIPPTGFDAQSLRLYDGVSAATSVTSVSIGGSQNLVTVEMISSGMTTYRPYHILANTLPSFIGFNAEL